MGRGWACHPALTLPSSFLLAAHYSFFRGQNNGMSCASFYTPMHIPLSLHGPWDSTGIREWPKPNSVTEKEREIGGLRNTLECLRRGLLSAYHYGASTHCPSSSSSLLGASWTKGWSLHVFLYVKTLMHSCNLMKNKNKQTNKETNKNTRKAWFFFFCSYSFLPAHSSKASLKRSLLYLTGICFNFHLLGVIFGNIQMSHINNLLNQNINSVIARCAIAFIFAVAPVQS